MARGTERDRTATVGLPVRMKEPLRAQIEEAAKAKGVSMNAEVVDRLERSFRNEELLPEILRAMYGRPLAGFLVAIGKAMNDAGRNAGFLASRDLQGMENWAANPYAYGQARVAAEELLRAFQPEGDASAPTILVGLPTLPPGANPAEVVGASMASLIVEALSGQPRTSDLAPWVEDARALFGEELLARLAKPPKRRKSG